MLPTVYEEVEEEASFPTTASESYKFQFPAECPIGIPNLSSRTPLTLSDLLQKDLFLVTPSHPCFVPSLSELLVMADVFTSTQVEALKPNFDENVHSSEQKLPINGGGNDSNMNEVGDIKFNAKEEFSFDYNDRTADTLGVYENQKIKDGESPYKTRKDSGSGRSGDEHERRSSSNRRNIRNGRGQQRRQRDKKWWVCPDPQCRTRNSIENNGCNNCGLVQDKLTASRHPFARNWDKTTVAGLVMTHVNSPTTVYLQTPQQQQDYARLRNCMAQSYADASYRPSLVAAKMLLGVKCGDGYERVRTEERKENTSDHGTDADGPSSATAVTTDPASTATTTTTEGESGSPSSSPPASPPPSPASSLSSTAEWRVQLVDRGSWTWVREDCLNFLLAGLSDLAPLATKYTLNELRVKRDVTEEDMEQSRKWLEDKLRNVKVDGDIYRQTKDHASVLYVDLHLGECLLNRAICELGTVQPKMNLKWLKSTPRLSTSSQEDAATSATTQQATGQRDEAGTDNGADNRSASVTPNGNAEAKEKRQRRVRNEESGRPQSESRASSDRGMDNFNRRDSSSTWDRNGYAQGGGRRGNQWYNNRRSRDDVRVAQKLPPLHDWAVLCFDQRTSHGSLSALCDMVERVGKDNRVSISSADSIRLENCEEDSRMVAVLAEVIATHPRLLLLLCVLPHHVQDYGGLERTGRSLGVCVVCVRGDSLSDPTTGTATRLLKDLQTALLNSPAILPSQGYTSGSGNKKRRDTRRRNQNRPRGSPSRGPYEVRDSMAETPSDPRLQAVIGAASQGISLLQKLSASPGGQQLAESSLSPGMKSLLQSPAAHQDIAKALESLEDLQVSYKQARSYTHEAFQAAGLFFSHLSTAIAPPAEVL